jgi:hypothetical protein
MDLLCHTVTAALFPERNKTVVAVRKIRETTIKYQSLNQPLISHCRSPAEPLCGANLPEQHNPGESLPC